MLTFHWCTVGSFMCGSNTVIGGASAFSCCGGVRKKEGLRVGGGSCKGNPPATVLLRELNTAAELLQPAVIDEKFWLAVENLLLQPWTSPGTRPAAAVTWNDEMVSNARP